MKNVVYLAFALALAGCVSETAPSRAPGEARQLAQPSVAELAGYRKSVNISAKTLNPDARTLLGSPREELKNVNTSIKRSRTRAPEGTVYADISFIAQDERSRGITRIAALPSDVFDDIPDARIIAIHGALRAKSDPELI